jgi:hypothetical protein
MECPNERFAFRDVRERLDAGVTAVEIVQVNEIAWCIGQAAERAIGPAISRGEPLYHTMKPRVAETRQEAGVERLHVRREVFTIGDGELSGRKAAAELPYYRFRPAETQLIIDEENFPGRRRPG